MFSKLFEILYDKIFVNIVVKKSTTLIYVEHYSSKKVIDTKEKEFEGKVLSTEMVDFIKSTISESPYFYISLLDYTKYQGAFPACSRKNLEYYKNMDADEIVCIKNNWSVYTLKEDLYSIEKNYSDIGIDFIFSPFLLLSHIYKEKLDAEIVMLILVEEESLSLSVFSHYDLLYAEYISTIEDEEDSLIDDATGNGDEENFLDENFALDQLEELDDLGGLEELDDLDDLGNIEDLDSLDEIDEFSDSKNSNENTASEEEEETSVENFRNDYQRFLSIQESVNHFYQSEKYKSEFIENVFIADAIGVSSDLKRYLEDEMFLSVVVRKVNLEVILSEMARLELSS